MPWRTWGHNDKIKPLQRTENQLLWDNTLPWYAFQRFGQGAEPCWRV